MELMAFFVVHRFAHMIFNSASDVSLSLPYMSLKNILQITILRFLFYYSFKTLVFFFFEANAKTCRQYIWILFTRKNCRIDLSLYSLAVGDIVYTATQFLLYSTQCCMCAMHMQLCYTYSHIKITVYILTKPIPCFAFSCRVRY